MDFGKIELQSEVFLAKEATAWQEKPMTVAMFAGSSMDEAGIQTRKARIKLCAVPSNWNGRCRHQNLARSKMIHKEANAIAPLRKKIKP